VRAEDSSSASANLAIFIRKTEWASAGILKVFPADGPSFFARSEDLGDALTIRIAEGGELSLDEAERVAFAMRAYSAERDAMALLARAEHTRHQLSVKLLKKDFPEDARDRALDRLEATGKLSDRRYAEAWLRSRATRRAEGRGKLLAGLLSRGIAGDTARDALEAFFRETDERALCLAAVEKLARTGRSGDKLVMSLIRKGFSLSLARSCIKMRENEENS